MAGQPNLNQMMKQVQKMQADMAKAQEELKAETVEASAGGGMVTVKISGDLELRELTIDPEAVDPEDVDMLQDMVQAAVNEAIRSAQELAASKMNAAAGGLAGPGGLGGPGPAGPLGRARASAAEARRSQAPGRRSLAQREAGLGGAAARQHRGRVLGQRRAVLVAVARAAAEQPDALVLGVGGEHELAVGRVRVVTAGRARQRGARQRGEAVGQVLAGPLHAPGRLPSVSGWRGRCPGRRRPSPP